jgi:hypothetical protein
MTYIGSEGRGTMRGEPVLIFIVGRAKFVTSLTKLAATVVIGAGGALVGIIGGWNLGQLTLELSRDQLTLVGGAGGILLALTACRFASEYAQARAQNERHLASLRRLATFAAADHRRDSKHSIANPDVRIAS